MSKSLLRASVCFPPALHTQIKMAIAGMPSVTLTDYVAGIVAKSGRISGHALRTAYLQIAGEVPQHRSQLTKDATRSTIMLDRKLAKNTKERADELKMSQSALIVAAVAHTLNRNGK